MSGDASTTSPLEPAAEGTLPRRPTRGWAGDLDVAALVVWALIWWLLFNQISGSWSVLPQYSYGWFVPLMGAFLWLNRWKTRPEPAPETSLSPSILSALVGSGVLALGLTRWIQEANRDWQLVSWLLGVEVVGISTLILFWIGGGSWVRHFLFPLLFPLVAVPWPSSIEQPMVQGLMHWVAAISAETLTHLGMPAIQHGNVVELSRGPVGIDDACSGIQSFQASVMMSLFLGEALALPWVVRLILLVTAVGWAFVCNLGRTLYLCIVTYREGFDALHAVHDAAGYVVMGLSYAGIIALALWIARNVPIPTGPTERMNPPRRWRWAWTVTLAVGLLAAVVGTEAWYRQGESKQVAQRGWMVELKSRMPEAEEIDFTGAERTALRYDEGQQVRWRSTTEGQWTLSFLRWNRGNLAVDTARNHNPSVCFVAAGFKREGEESIASFRVAGVDLPFRVVQFQASDRNVFSFFCFWDDFDRAGEPTQPWDPSQWTAQARFRNVWERRRTSGLQLLNAGVQGPLDLPSAKVAFQKLLDRIAIPKL